MRTSIATVSLSGDLGGKISAIATAGFDGFELFENDLTFSSIRPGEFRRLYQALGLTLFALQPFRDFEGLLDARRSAVFDRVERKFDLMEQLGTDLLLLPSSISPHAADGIDRYADDFRELGNRASERGFRVAYEALAWGRHIRDWMQAWEVVKRADHPSVGLVLDTYHLYVRGNPTAPIRDLPAEKIFMVQLADAPSLDMEVLRHSRHLRNFPGQGDYPIVDFLIDLSASGYDFVLSHEIFNDDFRIAPAAQTAVDGYRSMIWLEEQVAKRNRNKVVPSPNIPTWTSNEGSVSDSELQGVSFVEFSVSDVLERTELAEFFQKLGFLHSHTHRTKRVDLFSCGGAYLAVNSEPNSYASSFAERHGAAACAVGFDTPNAEAAIERAKKYLCVEIVGNRSGGEIEMPAISGVGGAIVYFVDSRLPHFTLTDFIAIAAESDSASANPRLPSLRFDHISQAVAPHELLSTLLFYRTALGFELQPLQELVDPNGLVTSRSVFSPNGQIRIPINAASSGETAPERFRSSLHGSGVQHIAIATDSIASVVEQVDGDLILSIPENYFDDLGARFGIDQESLEFFRNNNILYDRSDDGEFFHFYTREIHGVFFEFVQRNSYGGFGAANAPVRLAAQSRSRSGESAARL